MLTHYVGSITIQASALFYQACIYTNILYLVVTHEDEHTIRDFTNNTKKGLFLSERKTASV